MTIVWLQRFKNLSRAKKKGPDSDMLLANENGKFVDVTAKTGIENNTFALGLGVSDLNKDGYLEYLYF